MGAVRHLFNIFIFDKINGFLKRNCEKKIIFSLLKQVDYNLKLK